MALSIPSIVGKNGLEKVLEIPLGQAEQFALQDGLDLLQIADRCCPPSNGSSSFRVGNLAYNSSPMDVIMSDGRVIYGDLRYKEVSAFRRILPGTVLEIPLGQAEQFALQDSARQLKDVIAGLALPAQGH